MTIVNPTIERLEKYIEKLPWSDSDQKTYTKDEVVTLILGNIRSLISFIENEKTIVFDEMKGRLKTHVPRIFEMLNCYGVDARNIENGMTYLDSGDAQRLAQNIINLIEENW